jgi:phosphoribosylpyrophosphate synthetase
MRSLIAFILSVIAFFCHNNSRAINSSISEKHCGKVLAITEGQFSDGNYNIKVNKKSGNNGSV